MVKDKIAQKININLFYTMLIIIFLWVCLNFFALLEMAHTKRIIELICLAGYLYLYFDNSMKIIFGVFLLF